jgi:hypothetical protein
MRRSRLTSFDGKQFPLTLADGLRTVFADFASEPIPESLATPLSRLDADDVGQRGRNHIPSRSSKTL